MAATTIEPTPDAGKRPAGKAKAENTAVAPAPPRTRVFWRAVVRSGGPAAIARDRERVEWHLVGCGVPNDAGVHCSEGMHLIETTGHPDGHCVMDGACGLCGAPAVE